MDVRDNIMISLNQERKRRRNKGSLVSEPDLCIRCVTNNTIAREALHYSRTSLYWKYCSSQNFYFMKDINDFLDGTNRSNVGIVTSKSIRLRDYMYLDHE
jgi:hypothetical protein